LARPTDSLDPLSPATRLAIAAPSSARMTFRPCNSTAGEPTHILLDRALEIGANDHPLQDPVASGFSLPRALSDPALIEGENRRRRHGERRPHAIDGETRGEATVGLAARDATLLCEVVPDHRPGAGGSAVAPHAKVADYWLQEKGRDTSPHQGSARRPWGSRDSSRYKGSVGPACSA